VQKLLVPVAVGAGGQGGKGDQNARKLDEDTENFKRRLLADGIWVARTCWLHARVLAVLTGRITVADEKVSHDLKIRIQKARQAKGMTQKELAQVC
jgi:hypothetical protein